MNSIPAASRALDAARELIADLRLHLATRNLERALLELRYAPDQPRLPAGNPGGGQWTDAGLAGAQRISGGMRVAQNMGRQRFSGYLVRQNYIASKNISECTYYDSRVDYRFTIVRQGKWCPQGQIYY